MNKIAQISAKIGGGVALSLFYLATIAPADAATFDLTDGTGAGSPGIIPSFSLTAGGVTATFSGPDGTLRDSNGLRMYGTSAFGGTGLTTQVDVVFDRTVQLNGYSVGQATGLEGDETITATAGGETSVEGPFVTGDTGASTFANMITVAAGQVVSFTYSGPPLPADSGESIFWNNLEVTTVPEPASLVGLLGVGALGFASRKRK